ncbi:MAG: hypothetical protein Q8R56_17360, partial [Polaromonas sp.]|nr:hypothetical protein [Polaromonas sp.]
MTPTLFTACNALPPEGAELARGGPSLRSETPSLSTSCVSLPPQGALPALKPALNFPPELLLRAQGVKVAFFDV